MKTKLKSILAIALCAVGLTASALPPVPYRDFWSSHPDPRPIKDPTSSIDWGTSSMAFESLTAKHGKFLAASADAMIAAYTARIEKDPTDCEALISRALAYLKKAGENKMFDDLAKEFGYTFDNDTMHLTGELIQKKGVTPEMNEATDEVCDILLPLMKQAYADLCAIPKNWKGEVAITPDVYPVDEAVYFDLADSFAARALLAETMCVLNMVKGFDVTLDSDKLEDTFNAVNWSNGKRGVQAIFENNPEFFSKVRDQKALTEAGDWWASAATLLDQWDKAQAKRPIVVEDDWHRYSEKQYFFDQNFEKLDSNGTYGLEWLRRQSAELINLPYWASPIDYEKINGSTEQFTSFKPLFEGKVLRANLPEFGVGVKAPYCNEPLIDTCPDSTICGMWPSVSPTYLGTYISTRWTDIPAYTDNRTAPVYGIWYKNMFTEGGIGFENEGNPLTFAWDNATPIRLLDPEFNVRGVTAVFKGWSGVMRNFKKETTWEGSEIPTPITEPAKYVDRRVELTAHFDIPKVTYLDFDGTSGKLVERTAECEIVTDKTTTLTTGKVYVVVGDITIANRITVWSTPENPAKLVLCDEAKLAAANGIEVAAGNALTLCGQTLGTGTLEATGSAGAAGIGGGGTVTINGGTVMATGGSSSAGIGGGTVTINGGTVTAAGSDGAAGIGGTVKFGANYACGVAAGADEANALYMTAAAFTADHSAAYVALPCFSLKIPEATEGYSYEVSYEGVQPKAALADKVNTYAIAAGATARVLFTPGEDYVWVKAPEENPMIIANISEDTVVDAADLPTAKFSKKGSEENPWAVGYSTRDSVVAWTNGTDKLVVEGAGNMKDFTEGDPAPWGTGIAEVEIGADVTSIGARAFEDSKLKSVTIPASVTSIGAAAFFGSTSLSNVVVEAMTPPALGEGAFVELAEGYKIIVPKGTGPAYRSAPDWSLYADSIVEQGSPECPWQVGSPNAADVTAYTDGEGKLVIEGSGNMKDFDPPSDPAPWGTGVSEVEIGEGVTGIGANAFNDSQLGSVTIPASVTSIGAAAFFCSTSLSNVTVEAMTPPALGADAFAGTAEDLTIRVPTGTGAAYKAAPGWSAYAGKIVEQGPEAGPWKVGTGVTTYIDGKGTLHVEGAGKMKDFTARNPAPWAEYASQIKAVEVGAGVTKVGNAAFDSLDFETTTKTLTFLDETHKLNLLAFVSADKAVVNAPAAEAFRVFKSEWGTTEKGAAFYVEETDAFYGTIPQALSAGADAAYLVTLEDFKAVKEAELLETAGETPYSKTMQDLMDEALGKLDNATSYDEIMDGYDKRLGQIRQQAEKDKSNEIPGTDITWRILDGTLLIEGAGEMPDFGAPDFPAGAPWDVRKGEITSVALAAGIASVGDAALANCPVNADATVFLENPSLALNLGAFVSGDGSATNDVSAEQFLLPDADGNVTNAVTLLAGRDLDSPCYGSVAKALAGGATEVVAYTLDGLKSMAETLIAKESGPQPWTDGVQAAITKAVNEIEAKGDAEAVLKAGRDGVEAVKAAKAEDEKDPDLGGTIPGSDLKWAFAGNQLTISGSGAMPDVLTEVPWSKNVTNITTVVVGDEVTGISKGLFTAGLTAPVETVLFESAETWVPLEAFVSADGTKTNGAAAVLFNADGKYAAPYAWIGEDDNLYASYAEALAAGEQAVRPSFATSGGAEEQIEKAAAAIVERVQSYDEKTGRFTTDPEGSPIAVVVTVENVNTNEVETSGRIAVSGVDGLAEAARLEAAGSVGVTVVSLTVDAVQTNSMDDVQQSLVDVMTNDLDSTEGFVAKFAEITLATNDVPVAEAKAVIEIHIPYGTSGREDFTVTRIHGGRVEKFMQIAAPAATPADGTFMVGKNELVVWTMRFSLYAIGSTDSGMLDPSALGEVKYPKTPKVKGVPQEFLKEKSTATWTAKPYDACVFAGWAWANGTPAAAFAELSENELKNKTLKLRIAEGEKVRTNDVGAVWARIDEDLLGEVELTPEGLVTESKSYVTASVSGLPTGLKFNRKTLAIEWSGKTAPKDATDKKVKVSVKNASGYTFKQTFLVTVRGGKIARIVPVDDEVRTGEPVMLWGDAALGKVKGSKVYVAGKKASIRATPAKGSIFLGWYEDPTFRNAATNLPKGYLTASQSVVVPEDGGLHLFARFVELEDWAVGTFDGIYYESAGGTNVERGTVTLTVSSKGKVSGKVRTGGKTCSFSAKALADAFEVDGRYSFIAYPVMRVGRESKEIVLAISLNESTGLGVAEILFDEEDGSSFAEAVQNGWKLRPSALPAFPTRGALKLDLDNGLTLKFGWKGRVSFSGKVMGDNGKPVSVYGSTCVLPIAWQSTETPTLRAQVYVYVAPKLHLPGGVSEVYDVLLTVGADGKFDSVILAED